VVQVVWRKSRGMMEVELSRLSKLRSENLREYFGPRSCVSWTHWRGPRGGVWVTRVWWWCVGQVVAMPWAAGSGAGQANTRGKREQGWCVSGDVMHTP
jgi:hypothetical protein